MKFITINIYSVANLYPCFFCLFFFIRTKIEETYLNIDDQFFFSFIIYFSETLSIFGYCILIFNTKTEKKNDKNEENEKTNIIEANRVSFLIQSNIYNNNTIKLLFQILFVTLLDLGVSIFLSFPFKSNCGVNHLIRPFQLIINTILCFYFLKLKIYIHQILSILIIIISGLLLYFGELRKDKSKCYQEELFLKYFIGFILSGFLDITEKKILNYISPYLLLFLKGFMGMIINLIIIVLMDQNLSKFILNVKKIFQNILYIPFILSSTFFNIFFELTLEYLTPTHTCIGDILFSILYFIWSFHQTKILILSIIGYILLFFSCVLFNEFIILNFCGLNENTKFEIDKRTKVDKNLIVSKSNSDSIDVEFL